MFIDEHLFNSFVSLFNSLFNSLMTPNKTGYHMMIELDKK